MSNTIDIHSDTSLKLTKQEPLTVREKVVNLFQELEDKKTEQHRITTELNKEIQNRIEAETEANHLHRQVQLIEVNLDKTTTRINDLTTQLLDIIKVSETARYICNNLETKVTSVKDKEIDLDDELRKAKECSIETNKHFHENTNKLTELQERIEHAEHRSTIAEQRIASLEQDIRNAYLQMKSLIQAEEKTHIKEEKYRKNIEDLQSRLKAAQQRTDEAESDIEKFQIKIDKLNEKLTQERNKCHQIEKIINASSIS